MTHFRPSINTDPPFLADIWNESATGRGAYPARSPSVLERWLFSKPYFQNPDCIVALDSEINRPLGFALVGHGPNAERTALDPSWGVICAVVVRPDARRQGIGRELARRAEELLRGRGATTITLGSQWPGSPYLFGMYGGSNCPGILASEPEAAPFARALGFEPARRVEVYHKKLDTPLTVADARFGVLRRRYEAQTVRAAGITDWWHECVWGNLEPVEIRLTDKLTGMPAARAVVWELEGFSWRWNQPSAGILDVQVRPDLRRLGIGKLLVSQVLRFLQDQFFAVAELQVASDDAAARGLCQSLGFEAIDAGVAYERAGTAVAPALGAAEE